jgi:hypothetical protein
MVLYRWLVRVVDLSLFRALGVPLFVTALTLGLYYAASQWLNLASLPLFISFCIKSALTLALFYMMLIFTQPRMFSQRVRYVWRLARGTA